MAGRPVDEEILKMSLDNSAFMRDIDRTISALNKFKSNVEKSVDVKAGNFDKFTTSVGAGISGLMSKIPILRNFRKETEESANVNPSIFSKFTTGIGSGISSLMSKIPILNNFKKSTEESINVSSKPMDTLASEVGSDVSKINGALGLIEGGAQKAGAGFTALQGIALGALTRIGSLAVDKGMQITKSLAIKPLTEGFEQYSNKMSAVIMLQGALGEGANESINRNLKDLDQYAMVTKYSVADMQQNLSQFVNNGVQIDTASTAIKGFGNLAASAGASTEGFSSALQFGVQQALAMGKMTTQNWMSIENAGMATQKFKDALVEQAKEMGVNVDMTNGFRDSLQQGWLTNDVFVATLKKMANDKSMLKMAQDFHSFSEVSDAVSEGVVASWSNVFETLIGGAKESTKLWTDFGNAAITATQAIPEAVNKVAKAFVDMGGRKVLIDSFVNAFHSMQKIIDTVKTAFTNVFPVSATSTAGVLLKIFTELSKAMTINQITINNIGTIFRGLFSALSLGIRVIKSVGTAIGNMIPKNVHTGILDLVLRFSNFITSVDLATQKGQGMARALDGIRNSTKGLGEFIQGVADSFKGFGGVLGTIVGGVGKAVGFVFKSIGDGLKGIFGAMDNTDITNLGALAILGTIASKVSGLAKSFHGVASGFKEFGENIASSLDVFKALPEHLEALTQNIKSKTLMNIAVAIGILAASLFTLSTIDANKLGTSLAAVVGSLKILQVGMSGLAGMNFKKFASISGAALAMNGMATAMLTMSAALKVLSTIKPAQLAASLATVAGAMGVMVGTLKLMSNMGPGVLAGAAAMNLMATALLTLSIPIKIFAGMSLTEIAKGLGTTAGAMTIMVGGLAALSKIASGPKLLVASTAMIGLATAMNIMGGAIKLVGGMPLSEIAKGLGGVAGGVAIMGIAAKKIKNPANLIGLSTAMFVLSKALQEMGKMSLEEIGKSMIALAGGMTIMGVAMKLIGNNVAGAAGMTLMAAALLPMANALKVMGGIPLMDIVTGLGAFAGVALIMTGAAYALQGAAVGVGAFVVASAGMYITAKAMQVMSKAMQQFAKIPAENMAVALLGLVGALTALIAAGYAMNGAALGFVALSGGMALIGAGILATGVGVMDLVNAFDTLSKIDMTKSINNFKQLLDAVLKSIPAVIDTVIKAFGQILDGIVTLMPKIVKAIASGIDGLSAVIPNLVRFAMNFISALEILVPMIIKLAQDIIMSFLNSIEVLVPKLIETATIIVEALLNAFRILIPDIAQAGMEALTGFIQAIADGLPQLIQAGTDIIVNFLTGIANSVPQIAKAAADIIVAFIEALGKQGLRIVNAAADTLITFINGLADAVDTKGPQLNKAIWKLMNAVVNDIINFLTGGAVNKTGQNTIQEFIKGAVKTGATIWGNIVGFFTSIPGKIWGAISSIGQQAARGFGDFVNNARAGASRIWGNVSGWFRALPGNIWGAIAGIGGKAAQAFGNFINNARSAASNIWGNIAGFFTSIPGNIAGAIGDLAGIGSNIVQGIIRGIGGAMGDLGGALSRLAGSIPDKVAKFLGIKSPSRVMRDKIGIWIPAGIAAGIDKGSNSLDHAAQALATKTINAMSGVQDAIANNSEFTPVITPILDTTNIDNFAFNQGIGATIQNGQNLNTVPFTGVASGTTVAMTGDINIPVNVPDGTSPDQINAISDHLRESVKTIISDEIRKAI